MTRAILILAAVLAATAGQAADQLVIYKIDSPGYYAIQDGKLVPVVVVTPGVPTPTPDPTPVPVGELTTKILAEIAKLPADSARHTAAMKLCGVYQVISSKVEDDTIPFSSAAQGVDYMIKPAIGAAAAKAFEPVTNLVEAAMNGCTSKAECLSLMNEAATAILSTVPKSERAVDAMQAGKMLGDNEEFKELAKGLGFDWNAFLATLLKLFIELILPLIISAVKYGAFILIA